jgi:hypothetical protein
MNGVFSTRAVPRSYKEENWGNQVSSVRESVKKRIRWKGAAIQARFERWSRKISNVKAVARERLVKIQAARKGLAGAGVICELWWLAVEL